MCWWRQAELLAGPFGERRSRVIRRLKEGLKAAAGQVSRPQGAGREPCGGREGPFGHLESMDRWQKALRDGFRSPFGLAGRLTPRIPRCSTTSRAARRNGTTCCGSSACRELRRRTAGRSWATWRTGAKARCACREGLWWRPVSRRRWSASAKRPSETCVKCAQTAADRCGHG